MHVACCWNRVRLWTKERNGTTAPYLNYANREQDIEYKKTRETGLLFNPRLYLHSSKKWNRLVKFV